MADPSSASSSSSSSSVAPKAVPFTGAPLAVPIRCLFIDNYDSYSYNIIHLLALMSGCTPIVRWNTTPWCEIARLIESEHIDCVVISPGPGNPEHAKDFGVCTQLYQQATIPILGICLGLQGQCAMLGSRIVPAYEPRHGRLSKLIHDGRGIFDGVGEVQVIRYNSLVVDPATLHPSIEVSAWAEWDGQPEPSDRPREIMAVRRRCRPALTETDNDGANANEDIELPPRESVQFHPESICTQGGQRMLYNWCRIVGEWKQRLQQRGEQVYWHQRDVDVGVSVEDISNNTIAPSSSSDKEKSFTLLWRKLPFYVESEKAFVGLHGNSSFSSASSLISSSHSSSPPSSPSSSSPSVFWLDSSKVELGRSRFSYMGSDSGPLSYTVSYHLTQPLELKIGQRRRDGGTAKTSTSKVLTQPTKLWAQLEELLEARDADLLQVKEDGTISPPSSTSTSTSAPTGASPLPFNFEGGFVGYIGYGMKELCTPDSLPPMHLHFDPPTSPTRNSSFSGGASSSDAANAAAADFHPPDLAFIFADRMAVWDHETNEIYLTCLCNKAAINSNDDGGIAAAAASEQDGLQWMEEMISRLREISQISADSSVAPSSSPSSSSSTSTATSVATPSIHSSWFQSESEYLTNIRRSLDFIREGESYEICLTNQLDIRVDVPVTDVGASSALSSSIRPLDFYRTLRRVNPAAYAGFFALAYESFTPAPSSFSSSSSSSSDSSISSPSTSHWCICSSSPERFLQVSRDRIVESKPIKGTLARGATPELDEAAKAALQNSTKDFAENLMIVDLLRNDLGRVCRFGTVDCTKLMEVETYATIHNLVSTIRGRLRHRTTTFDVLQATFPPGSMTGAPKLRTCQILAALECEPSYTELKRILTGGGSTENGVSDSPSHLASVSPAPSSHSSSSSHPPSRHRSRGIYSGNIGFISINGGMSDLNVVIRTAVVRETVAPSSGTRSTHFRIGAGGAIVYMSDPQEEYNEILLKTKALVNSINIAAQELVQRQAL